MKQDVLRKFEILQDGIQFNVGEKEAMDRTESIVSNMQSFWLLRHNILENLFARHSLASWQFRQNAHG